MSNEDEIVVNPPQQIDVQYGDDVETTTVRGEVNGQQDAIVVVDPKTQETYTFNKKEIIEIVLKSPSFAAAIAKAISEVPTGSSVEANPTLAGTESSLTGLEVDGTKYKVEQPTEVVANPTLAGTEADLEGLQVGNTKYKVGGSGSGGGKVYEHTININEMINNDLVMITVLMWCSKSTALTKDEFWAFLIKWGQDTNTTFYPCPGKYVYMGSSGYIFQNIKIPTTTDGNFTAYFSMLNSSSEYTKQFTKNGCSLTDRVVEMPS